MIIEKLETGKGSLGERLAKHLREYLEVSHLSGEILTQKTDNR